MKDAKNHYRAHDKNYIGPLFRIDEDRLQLGIDTKRLIYHEMIRYCEQNNFVKDMAHKSGIRCEILIGGKIAKGNKITY